MIQRIQSLYLLISGLLAALCLQIPFFNASDGEGLTLVSGAFKSTLAAGESPILVEKHFYVGLAAAFTAILSLALIFMYKNRPLQMKIARLSVLLHTLLLVLMFYAVEEGKSLDPTFKDSVQYGISIVFPIAGMVLSFLASRAIMMDEALVRSSERLR